ncbi:MULTISPECIES: ExbD/TolR family protein [Tenacibaculum]|uniref:ExbD/TolR family protein n=1 Tax=Tenacibaculum TaxID=104267 RepID=UPI001F0A6649|nr:MULTISPECIES: biopolymer transporter ExbD [Tenacibaculum]MCH3881671.1 biopolymer transporter ExbD [Tenacibaculum aquimarinum]MDO6598744.1 biopolymer transporter ExbD [Tenacibaculum sp. 1_MG-2023]
MARRENPEINAGSMADIAFLLLIFFLVTTTMDVDSGISKRLAEKPPKNYEPPKIKQKNIFEISINRNNQLFVDGQVMEMKGLREAALNFIDNGGGLGNAKEGEEAKPCDYCQGAKDPESSDHPNKAIIAVESDRATEYGTYIIVQNELLSAYSELRNRLSQKKYNMSYPELEEAFKASGRKDESLRKKVEFIKTSYPQIITDIDPTDVN